MPALMVQGASSWSGKSLLATALARHFSRRGIRVAPFKAQNMSNNARVVAGGEIGAAQYLQGRAAGVEPDVRMNPVLVKPEASTRSQVVVLGAVDHELSRTSWRERAPALWPVIEESLRSLLEEFELVLIEGAGSPAEINLRDTDLANMRVARLAEAPVILVADIDRGGAFAHLYGTWALLAPEERACVRGFVLNKFRGDPDLLSPGPAELERLTDVPVIGVMPWIEHGLPDEDGAAPASRDPAGKRPVVAVIRYPAASNLDEFKALEQTVDLVWARRSSEITTADLVVLPGSKSVSSDIDWLRQMRFDLALRRRAREGGRVIGVCGGLQILGERIEDPLGLDGARTGLGLLPLVTEFAADKITRRGNARFVALDPPWQALSGLRAGGYEIRHGRTIAVGPVAQALPDGLGFASRAVLAVYLHGLFEDPLFVERLLGMRPVQSLEQVLDDLCDAVVAELDLDALEALVRT